MRIGAIIVSYRTGPALAGCLASLQSAAGLDEIILVDNGNVAAAAPALDAFVSANVHARLLRGHGNIGFSAACNMAASSSTADIFVFTNPDVKLQPDALPRLAAALHNRQSPAIVGGDLRDEAGRPDRGQRRDRLTLWRALVSISGLAKLERFAPILRDFNRHTDPLPTEPLRVGAVSGALMMMRRADFDAIGGFDERYFLHVEDIDICRRAEEAGGDVFFVPGPHGVHMRSTSDAPSGAVARHKAESMARYLRKFARGPVEGALTYVACALLVALTPKL